MRSLPATGSAAELFRLAGGGVGQNEGGAATGAALNFPSAITPAPDGGFLFAEHQPSYRVRRVSPAGIVTTVAGNGTACANGSLPCGDGGPATSASFVLPTELAITPSGGLLIGDGNAGEVRYVTSYLGGAISTVAGTGVTGFNGESGPATATQLSSVGGIVALPDGGFLVADAVNNRIRQVSSVTGTGTMTTIAGTGATGFAGGAFGGDGGPATSARLKIPVGLFRRADGSILFSDRENFRVREISPGGIISTVAGTGVQGTVGRGLLATQAQLEQPEGVAVAADGSLLIAEAIGNGRIARVSPSGRLTTVAGGGTILNPLDGEPATRLKMGGFPSTLFANADGTFVFADRNGHNIYLVSSDFRPDRTGPAGQTGPTGPAGAPGAPGVSGASGSVKLLGAVASDTVRGKAKRKTTVRLVLAADAQVTIKVRKSKAKKDAGSVSGKLKAGRRSLKLKGLPRGTYTLTLTVASNGVSTKDTAKLVIR